MFAELSSIHQQLLVLEGGLKLGVQPGFAAVAGGTNPAMALALPPRTIEKRSRLYNAESTGNQGPVVSQCWDAGVQ